MVPTHDEVDPRESDEATASHFLQEDLDDFDGTGEGDEEELDDADDLDDDEDEDLDDLDDDEDDDDELEDEDDEDLDDDELEDATAEEIDLVVALYREDGQPVAAPLALDLANDLDELITQLRRLPGDGGAIGAVSVAGEFFVLVRVRGRSVQVLLSDAVAANDWPIARDVADYLGEDIPDPDDDSEPMGDLGVLADQGISEFDMETIADDIDEDSDELVRRVVKRMKLVAPYERALAQQGKQNHR